MATYLTEPTDPTPCRSCSGRGRNRYPVPEAGPYGVLIERCDDCGGTGRKSVVVSDEVAA